MARRSPSETQDRGRRCPAEVGGRLTFALRRRRGPATDKTKFLFHPAERGLLRSPLTALPCAKRDPGGTPLGLPPAGFLLWTYARRYHCLSTVLFGVEPLVHYAARRRLGLSSTPLAVKITPASSSAALSRAGALLIGYSCAGLELTKEGMAHASARRETVRVPPSSSRAALICCPVITSRPCAPSSPSTSRPARRRSRTRSRTAPGRLE